MVDELANLHINAALDSLVISMVELFLLDRNHLMRVLLWENFTVGNWLNSGVVMVLVNLPVDGLRSLLMSSRLDNLASDRRVDYFIDVREVTCLGGKLVNGFSCSFHFAKVNTLVICVW